MSEAQSLLYEHRSLYETTLLENVLPFWLRCGLDTYHGGIYTCLDRKGALMDRTKSVWFQGRSAYIFAYVYNRIERKPEYLAASKQILDFLEKYCFDSDGRMFFEVTEEGIPLRKRRYVFSECFAVIAMAEYAKASKEAAYADKALALFKRTLGFLETPGVLEPKYLPAQQTIGHSISMILLGTAVVLKQVADDPILNTQIEQSFRLIKDKLYNPTYHFLLEMVTTEGEMIDTMNGRTINPGHCIETSWFLFEAAKACHDLHFSEEMLDFGFTILDDAWNWGWDKEYGGIINFKDAKGYPHQDYSQDMKFWWPQCEAIIANLYAYSLRGEDKYFERYQLAHDWAFKHLSDSEYPEWYGYLHRDGTVAQPAKGNLFKGPFHLPRMLVRSSLLIDDILAK